MRAGSVGPEAAFRLVETILEYADEIGQQVSVLVDLNDAGRPPPLARKAFLELTADARLGKTALHGVHAVARAMATFFLKWTEKGQIRFFTTEVEARAWLGEDNEATGGTA